MSEIVTSLKDLDELFVVKHKILGYGIVIHRDFAKIHAIVKFPRSEAQFHRFCYEDNLRSFIFSRPETDESGLFFHSNSSILNYQYQPMLKDIKHESIVLFISSNPKNKFIGIVREIIGNDTIKVEWFGFAATVLEPEKKLDPETKTFQNLCIVSLPESLLYFIEEQSESVLRFCERIKKLAYEKIQAKKKHQQEVDQLMNALESSFRAQIEAVFAPGEKEKLYFQIPQCNHDLFNEAISGLVTKYSILCLNHVICPLIPSHKTTVSCEITFTNFE